MKFKVKGDIKETISKVAKGISDNGGGFRGDENKGRFEVKGVSGNYNINGDICTIEIIDKPWLVSKSYVEDKILEFFS